MAPPAQALAEAGYRAVAPDMRGYGETDRPQEVEKYTLLHLVGDMIGLIDALGEEQAVDRRPRLGRAGRLACARFCAPIGSAAWSGLSVPFRPRGRVRPTTAMPQTDAAQFYQLYFQAPGVAEAEFERDPRETIRRLLYSVSGDAPRGTATGAAGPAWSRALAGSSSRSIDPPPLPPWLTEADVDFYAGEFPAPAFAAA